MLSIVPAIHGNIFYILDVGSVIMEASDAEVNGANGNGVNGNGVNGTNGVNGNGNGAVEEALPPPPPIPEDVVPIRVVEDPEPPVVKKPPRVPIARRGLASKGNKVQLLTNHFKVNVTNVDGHFFHYSVSFFYHCFKLSADYISWCTCFVFFQLCCTFIQQKK